MRKWKPCFNGACVTSSLPETMKEYFLRGKRNYVVTGTHGKTTTTSMLAWLMEDSGLNPSFMIGGIARNLGRGGRFTDSDFSVLEGTNTTRRFSTNAPFCITCRNWWSSTTLNSTTRTFTIPWRKSS
ncbi:MAG: Mur ligase family protein [Akkermansia sp.]